MFACNDMFGGGVLYDSFFPIVSEDSKCSSVIGALVGLAKYLFKICICWEEVFYRLSEEIRFLDAEEITGTLVDVNVLAIVVCDDHRIECAAKRRLVSLLIRNVSPFA